VVEGDEVGSRFSDKGSELSEELVHGITSLALIQDMGCPTSLKCCQASDRVDVFAVEDVDSVYAKYILGVGGCW
jgi:hypothetical protein